MMEKRMGQDAARIKNTDVFNMISDEKMYLRPYQPADAAMILSWCDDEKAFYQWTAGVMGNYPITPEDFRFVEKLTTFTACDSNGPVGFFTLRSPDGSGDELRFGFVIVDPEERGQGFGKEMLRLGLEYVFDVRQAKTASLGVFENNLPAYHCYRAVGFREIARERTESYLILGEEWKCREMRICSAEYMSSRQIN